MAERLAAIAQRLRNAPAEARAKGEAFADKWPGDHALLRRDEIMKIGEHTYLVGWYAEIANELELLAQPPRRRRGATK